MTGKGLGQSRFCLGLPALLLDCRLEARKSNEANLMSDTQAAVTTKLSQEIDWFSVSFT